MLDRILSTMSTTSDLGLVFPDDPGSNNWSSNLPYAQSLAKKLDISFLPSSINFPVGSMFWARKGALSRLYDIGLSGLIILQSHLVMTGPYSMRLSA